MCVLLLPVFVQAMGKEWGGDAIAGVVWFSVGVVAAQQGRLALFSESLGWNTLVPTKPWASSNKNSKVTSAAAEILHKEYTLKPAIVC
eukprot:1047252-Rhodomonas_salina.2